ncbi:uncharacterized protein Tsen54 [Plodia interpunctella]|uniref:uncharacterized protein Tsen54 n=1 Tax=Plodia interpunctella TaxID=58824 RepID=UPI0023680571|nr:uncharacterized protein LOC128673912 [Plodia interpunctella]
MSKPRLLSGEEIVAKGATKASVSLPEIGLKDVVPNGTWLEQKQIQSALDARKNLIEIERIEKCGNISHAQWREDLMLAEVTNQVGGYWQYLGHHSNKALYLNPEEALYLMEVNCLHLKYNEVTVSLQQAYSLLLRGQVSLMQYKVYASLSRLGYRIFRFSESKTGKINPASSAKSQETEAIEDVSEVTKSQNVSSDNSAIIDNNQSDIETKMDTNEVGSPDKITQNILNNADSLQNLANNVCEVDVDKGLDITVSSSTNALNSSINERSEITSPQRYKSHKKIEKLLQKRLHRSHSAKDSNRFFEDIPELLQKETVTVTVPTENLPDGVKPRYASYEINLNKVRTKNLNTSQNETNTFNENRPEFRWQSSTTFQQEYNNHTYFYSNLRVPRQPLFNQFNFWRPRPNWNTFPHNIFFQRPFMRTAFCAPRFQFFPRPHTYFRSFNFTQRPENITNPVNPTGSTRPVINERVSATNDRSSSTNSRKRTRDSEQVMRLNTIKNLASNLRTKVFQAGNEVTIVNFLLNLIKIYNLRYHARLRLTDDFEIDENENIVDTITLDDDEVTAKKPRKDESCKFKENLNRIQQLASKLKELDSKELATPQHRRALSSVVRKFNDSFNADVYMNDSYDIVDRRHIVLDSSSDSDCVIKKAEVKKSKKKASVGKKVRNPFHLLKTLSEKSKEMPSCSKDNEFVENTLSSSENNPNSEYSEDMKRSFKSWLPKINDFGRAEIASKSLMLSRIVEANRQTFLLDFLKNHTCKFVNWLDVKISFLETMEYASTLFHDDHVMENSSDWDSIIKPEDCKDTPSVLNKLSIIPNNSDTNLQTSLRIDFDVYNRDVQNFKKSNVPTPHFRIVCVSQSTCLPAGPDIAALCTQYDDAPIVFAVVGESVSYLQIKPTNLPVYIPEGEPA